MFTHENKLEPMEYTKRECKGARWTDAEIRYLIHRLTRGDDPEAIASDLLRSKSEVSLMGLIQRVVTVDHAA